MRRRVAFFLVLLLVATGTAAALGGCNKYVLMDLALWSVEVPPPARSSPDEPWVLLAGDMHCHVSPPDHPEHVGRALASTVELARDADLDFLVLTPHAWAGFAADEAQREEVRAFERELRAKNAVRGEGDPLLVAGIEYSSRGGHFGLSFADFDQVFADLSTAEAERDRAAFFRAFQRAGGFVVLNHPLAEGIEDSIVRAGTWDLSYDPWTKPGVRHPRWLVEAGELADGVETYNVVVDELRDRYLQLDSLASSRSVLARLDKDTPNTRRSLTVVGGSDSHSDDLRASTFVLATGTDRAAIREALGAGRVCIRRPAACSLRVRAPGGGWLPPGARLDAPGRLEVKARGDDIAVLVDGRVVGRPASGEVLAVEASAGCHVLRAEVDGGVSGLVYVGC